MNLFKPSRISLEEAQYNYFIISRRADVVGPLTLFVWMFLLELSMWNVVLVSDVQRVLSQHQYELKELLEQVTAELTDATSIRF
jgi:hypothetical protein